jgi:hypothetical protein
MVSLDTLVDLGADEKLRDREGSGYKLRKQVTETWRVELKQVARLLRSRRVGRGCLSW